MSFRLRLTVTGQNDSVLFNDQILGNNECFSRETIDRLGLDVDDDGMFEGTVDLNDFLEEFKNHHIDNVFPKLKNIDYDDLISNTFIHVPSYTITGNYAIVYDALFRLLPDHYKSATLKFS